MLTIAITAHAQPDVLWSQTYGGESLDVCTSVIQTADGGFALAGCTSSFGEGETDFWLVVTDDEGERLWSQTYGGDSSDVCMSVIQTADSGFALAGYTGSYDEADSDFWLVVTDDEGEELWSRTYHNEEVDICYSAIQTANGGFALAGFTGLIDSGIQDFWLVRTDEEGNELWSQTYGGVGFDMCQSVIQTTDGGYALAGFTDSFGENNPDFWLIRTDEDGERLWSQTYGGEAMDFCYSVIRTTNGGFALAGYTDSLGERGADFLLVKTGPDPVSIPTESFIPHPTSFILHAAYPNPFNATTTIEYALPFASQVSLNLYNLSGQRIETLVNGRLQAGVHRTMLNAANLSSGLYFVRLEASEQVLTRKVMLIK